MTCYEFERRYNAMPRLKKAELIEGVVYMPAALRFRSHGEPHGRIMAWLVIYGTMPPGVAVGDTPTVRLDIDNEPQNWFYLESGEYLELLPDQNRIWQSRTFPGLWLDQAALLEGNMQRVFEVLQMGLQTVQHEAFVQQLSCS